MEEDLITPLSLNVMDALAEADAHVRVAVTRDVYRRVRAGIRFDVDSTLRGVVAAVDGEIRSPDGD